MPEFMNIENNDGSISALHCSVRIPVWYAVGHNLEYEFHCLGCLAAREVMENFFIFAKVFYFISKYFISE